MYNPEKQARTAGGRFGAKVEAKVEAIMTDGKQAVTVAAKTADEALHDLLRGEPGEIVVIDAAFDYPDIQARAWVVLLAFVAAAVGLAYAAVSVLL